MKTAIKLTNLTKSYGKTRGVLNLNLEVPKGTIYGYLGPNGAGKTTTISLLVDLLRPSAGTAEIFGFNTVQNSLQIRQRIGYLAGDMELDGALTGRQQLEFFGHLRGNYDGAYVTKLANKLDSNLGKKIKTLSRGNKQKIGLISALMHKPELLILDEPTSGLDPLIQEQFNDIIRKHKETGNTTFISSHILSEVQELCDNVAFIKDGQLVADEPIEAISQNAPYHITIVSDDKKLSTLLKKLPEVQSTKAKHMSFSFVYVGDITKLMKLVAKYPIIDININRGNLESAFMEFYKK